MAFINGNEILFSPEIYIEQADIREDLEDIKRAIWSKGGDIAESAELGDVPGAIYDLPVGDPNYLLVEDRGMQPILSGAGKYATIDRFGGTTVQSRGLNWFDETQITGVDGLCSSSTPNWGKIENGELVANRAYFSGTNKWLGFSMELTAGTYYMRAKCRLVKTLNDAERIAFGLIKVDETDRYAVGATVDSNIDVPPDGEWYTITTSVTITDEDTYYLLAQAYGDKTNSTGYECRFKEIYISPIYSKVTSNGGFVTYRGIIGTLEIPNEIQALDGYGLSCGSYEQSEYPYNMLYPCNKVDLENGTYVNEVGRYVFTGEEGIVQFLHHHKDGLFVYYVTVPVEIYPIAPGITVECDGYTSITNSWNVLEEDWYEPNCINANSNNVIGITSNISTMEELCQALKGATLKYVRKSPIVTPLPVKMDTRIEIEPYSYITNSSCYFSYLRRVE